MKNIINILTLTIIACSHTAFTMEKEQKPHILVIPGHDGFSNQNRNTDLDYIKTILPYFAKNNTSMHHIGTPEKLSDFGQNKCQKYLEEKINWCKDCTTLSDNDPLFIYGSLQGSATAINYTAKHPENVKALILESVILTGNSFIEHTLVGDTDSSSDDCISQTVGRCCHFTSAGYYLFPQLVRMKFWHYCPSGEQPINNVGKLPANLPIIIVHNTKASQVPFKDAQALYAFLTNEKQNHNVYLFAQEKKWDGHHLHLLGKDNTKEITAINTILKLHNLLPSHLQDKNLTPEELKEYQPDVDAEWLDRFNVLAKKEKNMPYVLPSVATICAVACALMKCFGVI